MRVFGQHAVAAAVLLGGTPNLAEGRGRLRGLHTRGTQKSAAAAHQKKMKKTLMTIGETNPAEDAANAKMDKETDAKALADANAAAAKAKPTGASDAGVDAKAKKKAAAKAAQALKDAGETPPEDAEPANAGGCY
eukprot:g8455.t1